MSEDTEKLSDGDGVGLRPPTDLLDLLRGVDAAELFKAAGTLPEHKLRVIEAAKYAFIDRQNFAAAAKLRDAEQKLKAMWEVNMRQWAGDFLESGWDGDDWNVERMKELVGALKAEMESWLS